MPATENVVRDLLNTMREAALRLSTGSDPDEVADYLMFAADSYASTAPPSPQ